MKRDEGLIAGEPGENIRWAFMTGMDVGTEGDPYLDRLRLVQTPWFGIYLHHIHRPDQDRDPHDHPWWFASLVLCGSYGELHWPDKHSYRHRVARYRRRWSWRTTSRRAAHIITSVEDPLWTLVITGPRRAGWGFWVRAADGSAWFVPWRDYIAKRGAQ